MRFFFAKSCGVHITLTSFPGLSGEELGLTADGLMVHAPRQKRIRTSFKHQQIRILKSYFALNQNPDAKDLKQLAQKTGLTKRVLQVRLRHILPQHISMNSHIMDQMGRWPTFILSLIP